MDYFYSGQTRRYISQFLRIFSDIKYRTDPDENGFSIEARVPVKYGDISRMVASILNGNTENNAAPVVPCMSGHITGLKLDEARRHDPTYVTTVQAAELAIDQDTGQYTNKIGNRYSVERYMPVPYTLEMRLDIMTSNSSTKMQLLEQILTIFNPMLELQQNENPLDWSRVFQVILTGITWSNRNIPVGDNLDHDVASLDFQIPIWISPPAKEKRQRIISSIITRVFDSDTGWDYNDHDITAQINLTSENLKLDVSYDNSTSSYIGQLLNSDGGASQNTTWVSKMKTIGTIVPGRSTVKLRLSDNLDDTDGDLYGIVTGIDPLDASKITFEIDSDSLPATIIDSPITAIINPLLTYPGNGITASNTAIAHRYMLMGLQDNNDPVISTGNIYWGGLLANNNDIIEFKNGAWEVIFNSQTASSNQYVVNLSDGNHYRFDGSEWVYTILGVFNPAYWAIIDIAAP